MAEQVAWLFPGQGSQAVGMGRAFAEAYPLARATLEEADEVLGFALSRLMAEGPKAELDDTLNTQPALFAHSVAVARVARAEGLAPLPDWVAGHSLGEYSAMAAVGALPFAEGLRLVRERGRLMQAAGARHPGGMAAVLGLGAETLAALCAGASAPGEPVQIANDNCPGQIVISGARAAVLRASEAARSAGARQVIALDVSIAAHSPLMADAQPPLAAAVGATPFQRCEVPLIANVSARPIRDPDELRAELVAQLTGSVRWADAMRTLIDRGVGHFYELGSGTVLTGLLKRIDRGVARYNLG